MLSILPISPSISKNRLSRLYMISLSGIPMLSPLDHHVCCLNPYFRDNTETHRSCHDNDISQDEAGNEHLEDVLVNLGFPKIWAPETRIHRLFWNVPGPCSLWVAQFWSRQPGSMAHMLHVWYIYLQNWVIYGVNVGKYSSTMEHMGGYSWI